MTASPNVRRLLYTAIAVFLVAGVLAAAVVGAGEGRDPSDVNIAAGSTTTTSAVPAGAGGAVALDGGGGGGDTAPAPATGSAQATTGDPSSTTAKPSTGAKSSGSTPETSVPPAATSPEFADLGPAPDGGAVAVPRNGTYRYGVKRGDDKPAEGTTKVEDKGASADGGRNLAVSIAGQGFDSVSDVRWGPVDVKVTKSTFAAAGKQYECDWEPDYVETVLALAKGTTWEAKSSCTIAGMGPTPTTITRSTKSTVTDARRVRVAGREINVWLITSSEKFEFAGRAQEATTTTWFSGQHGLAVRTESKTAEGDATLEIKNLDPA